MRHAWYLVWGAIGALAIVVAMGMVFLAYIFWPHCDREEKVLATDTHGRSIVSCFEACTSVGTSMEETIELKSASGGRQNILRYEPNGGIVGCNGKTFPDHQEPRVDWSNPRVIHVSISVVSAVIEKQVTVDGVTITYDIGTVISQDCGLAMK